MTIRSIPRKGIPLKDSLTSEEESPTVSKPMVGAAFHDKISRASAYVFGRGVFGKLNDIEKSNPSQAQHMEPALKSLSSQ